MPKAPRELYDLVIVGGGPAGAAAALCAGRQGAAVLVIEKERFPRASGAVGWLGARGVELCRELGLEPAGVGAAEFSGVRLHSWDFKRSTAVSGAGVCGWLLDRGAFDQGLLGQAVAAGAEARHGVVVADLKLGEERAALRLSDGRQAAGRIVLIADGALSTTAQLAKLPCAAQHAELPQALFLRGSTRDAAGRLDVIIDASRAGRVATIVQFGRKIGVLAIARSAGAALRAEFGGFCAAAARQGLLPDRIACQPEPVLCPSGMALDMDTHVGKRCLLTGDAGGFVSAFSGEGIYPAMRSGWIAAETALRALNAPVVQDELATFGPVWRGELADYLRMPNTDLGLLMPLVFNNEQMSLRVAWAFLAGQTL